MSHIKTTTLQNRPDGILQKIKKRPNKFLRLAPLGIEPNIQKINRIEKDLIRDIQDIDDILSRRQSNMIYVSGYLFCQGTSKQVIKQFHSALQINSHVAEDGFYLWKLKQKYDRVEVISSKLVSSPRNFPQKLLDKSVQKLQKFQISRHFESINKGRQRWNTSVNVKPNQKIIRVRTDISPLKIDDLSKRKYSNEMNNINPKTYEKKRKLSDYKLSQSHKRSHSNYLPTEISLQNKISKQQDEEHEIPRIQQLNIMLHKQNEIVSIWMPPSSCPQFFGIMSIEFKQKSYNIRYCMIKKYYWYRYGLSRRLFDSILNWANRQYDFISQLVIITTRQIYNSLFSSAGWQISGWISDNKIKISYSKL